MSPAHTVTQCVRRGRRASSSTGPSHVSVHPHRPQTHSNPSTPIHGVTRWCHCLPVVFKVCRAGANMEGKKKKSEGTRVTLGKEHLQPKALHVHFWPFFFFHSNVTKWMSTFHQAALRTHRATTEANKPPGTAALMTADVQILSQPFTARMQQTSRSQAITKFQMYAHFCTKLVNIGIFIGWGSS